MDIKNTLSSDTLLSRNEIPIIDLAYDGSAPTKLWFERIAKQLNHALTTKGLLFFVNHSITEEKLQSVYEIMDEFCSLPDDVREKYKVDPSKSIQGYVPVGMERLDNSAKKEMRHCYSIKDFSLKLPTEEIPDFKKVIGGTADDFLKLTCALLKALAIALEFNPEVFLSYHKGMLKEDNNTNIRMLYYPPLENEPLENTTRCGEHTDWGTVTLLIEDTEGGLEIFHNGEWRRVGHLPGAIMMNLGDLMEKWCYSKYKAVRHRVVVPEDANLRKKGRHSIAFFVNPDFNTPVESPSFARCRPSEDTIISNGNITKLNAYEYMQQKVVEAFM